MFELVSKIGLCQGTNLPGLFTGKNLEYSDHRQQFVILSDVQAIRLAESLDESRDLVYADITMLLRNPSQLSL
ncbi:MAG TPA: hypothetical protein VFR24_18000 [Candidatus Angelobacter sp.]|nr:hypothetical protein [Candidatus Angelobacter sp.]